MIKYEYIKGCLDSRGMPTDHETVLKAKARWQMVIDSYEDDYFTQDMIEIGINPKE